MRWTISLLALFVGCGGDGGGGNGTTTATTGDASETSAGPSDTSSGSSGGSAAETTGGDGGLSHGFVQLELVRAESQADDPFAGTATVIAVLQYADCLGTFYADHPELRQDGADGAAIFGGSDLGGEGWQDRL